MKRFSKDVYHLMVLLPIFGSWPLSLFFSYLSIPAFYTSLINCALICVIGFGACGAFVSRGKGYLWKDYLFILFVCMAVLGSIFSDFFRAITELITTIGIFGIIVLILGNINNINSEENKEKKEQGWRHYTYMACLILTCAGIVFVSFHWPYGKVMIKSGLIGIFLLWISRKWQNSLYKGDYENQDTPQ
jgi:hypothetical protein